MVDVPKHSTYRGGPAAKSILLGVKRPEAKREPETVETQTPRVVKPNAQKERT